MSKLSVFDEVKLNTILPGSSGNIRLGSSSKFFYKDSTGEIGIGTVLPTSPLHVDSSISTGNILVHFDNNFGGGGGTVLKLETSSGNVDAALIIDNQGTGNDITLPSGSYIKNGTLVLGGELEISPLKINHTTDNLVLDSATNVVEIIADTDATIELARAKISSPTTDIAFWSHYDRASNTDFAIRQAANGRTAINSVSGEPIDFLNNGAAIGQIDSSGNLNVDGELQSENGILKIQETTTPTATTNYGKIYTKTDNNLYFQDGAGAEHEIAFV
jgi:hypothetical protein